MAPKGRSRANSRASSSGLSRSHSTDSSSPTSTVGNYDILVLSHKWDDDSTIRARIRDEHYLCRHFDHFSKAEVDASAECTVEDTKVNKLVIAPILCLMSENQCQLPSIDRLIEVIDRFYKICKKPKSLEHSYNQAWSIRRLLGQVKQLAYKDSPPQDCMV